MIYSSKVMCFLAASLVVAAQGASDGDWLPSSGWLEGEDSSSYASLQKKGETMDCNARFGSKSDGKGAKPGDKCESCNELLVHYSPEYLNLFADRLERWTGARDSWKDKADDSKIIKKCINLSEVTAVEIHEEHLSSCLYGFKVTTSDKVYYFRAKSGGVCNINSFHCATRWVQAIRKAIRELNGPEKIAAKLAAAEKAATQKAGLDAKNAQTVAQNAQSTEAKPRVQAQLAAKDRENAALQNQVDTMAREMKEMREMMGQMMETLLKNQRNTSAARD